MRYDPGYSERNFDHSSPSILGQLNRLLFLLVLLAIAIVTFAAFMPVIRSQHDLGKENQALSEMIVEQRLALEERNRQLHWLKNDPEYLEILARNRMDLMKEGEMIFRVDIPEKAPAPIEAAPAAH